MITYSDLKKTFPEEKKLIESIYGRIIPVRKISYFVTIPLLYLKCSAFAASVLSIFIAVAVCVCLSLPNSVCRIVGVVLVPVWHLFDCVDGNIARYTKTVSPLGSVVDAISGYYCFAFLPLALGVAAFNVGDNYLNLPAYWFLMFAGLASVSNLLSRLIYQKYANGILQYQMKTTENQSKETQGTAKKMSHLQTLIAVNLGPLGLPMFVLWFSPVFNLYHLLVIYYFAFYFASLIFFTAVYLKRCKNFDGGGTAV